MKTGKYINLHCQTCFLSPLVGLFILPIVWSCSLPISVPPLGPEDVPRLEAAGNYPHHVYRIEPGDTLQIRYPFHPEMDQGLGGGPGVVVQPDGKITATMVGEITVAGMTTAELEKELVERTSDRLRNPEVVVSITQYAERNVYIGGEVGKPGIVPYRKGLTPLQAILAAGGFQPTAKTDSVILIRADSSKNNVISRQLNIAGAITDGIKEPVYLAPHDVVYVPRTGIAEANLWVKQHVTDLFPFLRGGGPIGFITGFIQ